MASLLDYALLCQQAYSALRPIAPPGWLAIEGRTTGTGFKGALFARGSELVVAYAGTDTENALDFISDLTADLRLMTDMPRQTSDAYDLYNHAKSIVRQTRLDQLTVCGHSLGGGLSQHIGYWTKNNFVTFNAPGVYTGIQGTKVAFLHSPMKAWRTIAATFTGHADGRNYRLPDDPVSRIGLHYGRVRILPAAGGASGHGIAECIKALRGSAHGGDCPFGY